MNDIVKAMPSYGTTGRVYVLAWQIREDNRPLRVESCLVLKVLDEDSKKGRWCLATLYRHPTAEKPEWRLSMIHGTNGKESRWIFHVIRMKNRPRNREVYAALDDVGWSFEKEKDWKFVGCGVCEKTWRAALGEKPTKSFGR